MCRTVSAILEKSAILFTVHRATLGNRASSFRTIRLVRIRTHPLRFSLSGTIFLHIVESVPPRLTPQTLFTVAVTNITGDAFSTAPHSVPLDTIGEIGTPLLLPLLIQLRETPHTRLIDR